MWERQEVAQRYDDRKTIIHPELGRIDVDCQVLFTENRAQTLIVLTARPGTESHSKLELLSVIGHQQFTPWPAAPPDRPAIGASAVSRSSLRPDWSRSGWAG